MHECLTRKFEFTNENLLCKSTVLYRSCTSVRILQNTDLSNLKIREQKNAFPKEFHRLRDATPSSLHGYFFVHAHVTILVAKLHMLICRRCHLFPLSALSPQQSLILLPHAHVKDDFLREARQFSFPVFCLFPHPHLISPLFFDVSHTHLIDTLKKHSIAVGGSDLRSPKALYQVEVTQKEEKSEEVAAGKSGLQSDLCAQKRGRVRDQDTEKRLRRSKGFHCDFGDQKISLISRFVIVFLGPFAEVIIPNRRRGSEGLERNAISQILDRSPPFLPLPPIKSRILCACDQFWASEC